MRNHYSWMMLRGAALVAASAFVISACGGSAEFRPAPDGAAGQAAGGAPSAGAGGAGGAAAGAGTAGAGAHAGAGVSGGGSGGGDCDDVPCLDIGCGTGYKSVPDPNGCCTTCVPDGSGGSGGSNPCETVDCAGIACGPGTKYALLPGQCCGTCVPDPEACSTAQAEYRDLRERLLAAPNAVSCTVSADCEFLASNPSCGDACVSSAVNAKSGINQQLSQFANANCSSCPVVQAPCFAPPPPLCVQGMCVLGGFA